MHATVLCTVEVMMPLVLYVANFFFKSDKLSFIYSVFIKANISRCMPVLSIIIFCLCPKGDQSIPGGTVHRPRLLPGKGDPPAPGSHV